MKFLVIGLGSMGKRRVRNLLALGYESIAGFDPQEKRTAEAHDLYGIEVFGDFETAMTAYGPDVFVISTPPDKHMHYAFIAQERGIHAFIEASVVDAEKILELAGMLENGSTVIVPSCTMRYFPAPQKIKELLRSGVIGKPLNFNYQSGQYLPDWHPWEKIEDFYVSNPETGGCREIVPFELTWLNDLFGDPEALACVTAKQTDMNAQIDDIYHCLLRYPNGLLGNMTVEVISRPKAVRDIRIIGSEGEIVYSADTNALRYISTGMDDWESISFEAGTIEKEYINPEEPYINEMKDFVAAVGAGDRKSFPNTLEEDYKVLQTLYALENLTQEPRK